MIEYPPRTTKDGVIRTREHRVERRKLILGGVVLVAGAAVDPLIAIPQAAHTDGSRKINFAGRQRMLIQRAGKFVCLARLAPKPLPLLAAAQETLALHHRTEDGLQKGDEEFGLEPEANARVLKALRQASNAFLPYGETIRDAIERRAVEPGHLKKIAVLNNSALNAMDAAVNIIQRVYENDLLSEQLAILINISGRQRMFTQRMVLQLCLYRSATKSESSPEEFFRTMNRFSISLNILQRVTPAVVPENKHEPLISNLRMALDNWEKLKSQMSRGARPVSGQWSVDLLDIDRQAEYLLKKMNEIVLLYEGAAG